ncbi:MAG: L-serine dehydratase [Desulforhopalus sp.]|jgi:L-serine dehydratase
MFISVLDLFKIGIGPSSSHTMGPMIAALEFRSVAETLIQKKSTQLPVTVRCTLKGSLSYTGKGHSTDKAVVLGLHGHAPIDLVSEDVSVLIGQIWSTHHVSGLESILFSAETDIIFDLGPALPEHPNGMLFDIIDAKGNCILTRTYFSIGGGFLSTPETISSIEAPLKMREKSVYPYPFDSAKEMLRLAKKSGLSIAEMKRENELTDISNKELNTKLDEIWNAMQTCVERGLQTEGELAGGLGVKRRAKKILSHLQDNNPPNVNEWLCAYAFAASEENGSGHMVVTAPTNGAAGVIPAVIYYGIKHLDISVEQIRVFLLTAAAIGGLIKHRSSISGAEVGCQGEVGSASAMAAAGLCAIQGGTPMQVEHAAEMALEHHLGMTCDPVAGLVQVPCIERNGFGAVKAFTASSLALLDEGQHFMPLDSCIAAMKQTGLEMSEKFKETSLGGLAISYTEC